jgi:hypothetical protein
MVRCTPGAEQSEYQGERDGVMHAPLSMQMVVTLLTALLAHCLLLGYQIELFRMAAAEVGQHIS